MAGAGGDDWAAAGEMAISIKPRINGRIGTLLAIGLLSFVETDAFDGHQIHLLGGRLETRGNP
jgi:hypothetical protein